MSLPFERIPGDCVRQMTEPSVVAVPYRGTMLLPLLLAASSAPAPPIALLPNALVASLGPLRPQVGAWVEYLVRSRGEQDVRVRMAVVAPTDPGHVRIEVATVGSRSLPFAARLSFDATTGKLEHASLYALGQAPLELPVDDGETATRAPPPAAGVVHRRTQTITVPAGTFSVTEVRVDEGSAVVRVWRTDEVPLWGVARVVRRGQRIELVRYGRSGARTVFPSPQGIGSDRANE